MNRNTLELLSRVKSPSIMDILRFQGMGEYKYDAYSNNTHSSDVKADVEELNNFCRMLFIDYRNRILNLDKAGKCDSSWKRLVDMFKSPQFDPKEMDNRMGTPYYDFVCKDFKIMFGKDFMNIAKFQAEGDITKGSDDFMHVHTYLGTGNKRDQTDLRLYLNLMGKNIVKFSEEFYLRSRKNGLPGYFKLYNADDRNDNFVIYSSYENLDKYVEIIESMRKDRSELFEGTEKVSCNMATLNGYIGYGEEPKGVDGNGQEVVLDDDGKMSYNERLGYVTEEIFNTIRSKSFDYLRGINCVGEVFSNNEGIFGTSNMTFKDYLYSYTTPLVEREVNRWLKTPEGLEWARKTSYLDKTKLLTTRIQQTFDRQFIEFLISGRDFNDITDRGCNGLIVPITQWDFLEYLKNAMPNPKHYQNSTIFRAHLCKSALLKDNDSENNKKLFLSMVNEMNNWIRLALKNDPNNFLLQAIAKELDDGHGNLSSTGKALVVIAASGFLTSNLGSGIYVKAGEEVFNIAEYINKFNLCESVVGEGAVEQLAKDICDRKNINFKRVCFNETTLEKYNIPDNSNPYSVGGCFGKNCSEGM